MTIKEELQTRNFSIYAQWLGLLSMVICLYTGLSNIVTLFSRHALLIIFCAISIASSFVILFIEVPMLLRICPTSSKFDKNIKKAIPIYIRAIVYGSMAASQFFSIMIVASSLIAAGALLLLTAICYLLAAVKRQDFIGIEMFGGQGFAVRIPV